MGSTFPGQEERFRFMVRQRRFFEKVTPAWKYVATILPKSVTALLGIALSAKL